MQGMALQLLRPSKYAPLISIILNVINIDTIPFGILAFINMSSFLNYPTWDYEEFTLAFAILDTN